MRQERCGGPPTRSFPTHHYEIKVTTSVVSRWEFLRPTTCTFDPTSLRIRTLRAMAEENGGVGIRTRRHLTNSDRHLIWMEGNFWTKIGKQWCSEHYRVPWLLRLFAREPHTIPIQPLPYLVFGRRGDPPSASNQAMLRFSVLCRWIASQLQRTTHPSLFATPPAWSDSHRQKPQASI